MADVDLSSPASYPAIASGTTSGVPGNVRRILLPTHSDVKLTIYAVATDVELAAGSNDLADEAANGGVAAMVVPRDMPFEVECRRANLATPKVYLFSTGAAVAFRAAVELLR